jgi:hypothetical protein
MNRMAKWTLRGFGIGAAALSLAFGANPSGAASSTGPSWAELIGGTFLGNGYVTAVSGSCTVSADDTFTPVLSVSVSFSPHHGARAFTLKMRQALNDATDFGVYVEEYQAVTTEAQTTGTYMFGLEGTTLSTGNYTVTGQVLSADSFLVTDTLTYTPLGGSGTCTESDQIVFIRTSDQLVGF